MYKFHDQVIHETITPAEPREGVIRLSDVKVQRADEEGQAHNKAEKLGRAAQHADHRSDVYEVVSRASRAVPLDLPAGHKIRQASS